MSGLINYETREARRKKLTEPPPPPKKKMQEGGREIEKAEDRWAKRAKNINCVFI